MYIPLVVNSQSHATFASDITAMYTGRQDQCIIIQLLDLVSASAQTMLY